MLYPTVKAHLEDVGDPPGRIVIMCLRRRTGSGMTTNTYRTPQPTLCVHGGDLSGAHKFVQIQHSVLITRPQPDYFTLPSHPMSAFADFP